MQDLKKDLGLLALIFITFAFVCWFIGILIIIKNLIIW